MYILFVLSCFVLNVIYYQVSLLAVQYMQTHITHIQRYVHNSHTLMWADRVVSKIDGFELLLRFFFYKASHMVHIFFITESSRKCTQIEAILHMVCILYIRKQKKSFNFKLEFRFSILCARPLPTTPFMDIVIFQSTLLYWWWPKKTSYVLEKEWECLLLLIEI